MKILVTNTLVLNGGDAAIQQGQISLFERVFGKDIRVCISSRQGDLASRHLPEMNLRDETYGRLFRNSSQPMLKRIIDRFERMWERPDVGRFFAGAWLYGRGHRAIAKALLPSDHFSALERFAAQDLIVSTGGTYLVEHYDLEPKLFDLITAVLLKKPLVLFTQSLGPFQNERYRRKIREVVNAAKAVFLRDERSKKYLLSIGAHGGNLYVTADAAFALADPNHWRPELRSADRLRVAISVREWSHFSKQTAEEGMSRYITAISELTEHLVRSHNAEVTFVSTCQGIPEYWTDDSEVATKVRHKLPSEVARHVTVDRTFHPPHALMQLMRGFDLVIATRLHMAILSLCAGVPVVAVAYEFKTMGVFRELGHHDLVHDIETLSGTEIAATVDRMVANLGSIRDSLRKATLLQRDRTHESARLLSSLAAAGS